MHLEKIHGDDSEDVQVGVALSKVAYAFDRFPR